MSKHYTNREDWLLKLQEKFPKPQQCQGCDLQNDGAGFARTLGTGKNGVGLVLEALGETEAIKGLPVQGEAGMGLRRVLHRVGQKIEDFLVFNTICCNPPFNVLSGAPYEHKVIAHCSPYFDETVAQNPHVKVLVPMGQVALHKLLNVDDLYGFHGTVHWHNQYKKWIVPTYHPSYLLQTGFKEALTVISDLNRAFEVITNGGWTPPAVEFIEYPTLASMTAFVEEYERALLKRPETMLSVDIETPYSAGIDEEEKDGKDSSWTIERISFSFRRGHAITAPWTEPFIGLAGRLLANTGCKVFWNGNKFDVPRLRNAGTPINGTIIDGMDAHHFLYSDIPRGLGYVTPIYTRYGPWKHLAATNMPFYSCMDAVSALENVLEIKKRLEKDDLWRIFMRDFVAIEPTFQVMSSTGIGIDSRKKQELCDHYTDLRDNSNENIQGLVPLECLPLLKKGGYKGKPADVRAYIKSHAGVEKESAFLALGYEKIDGTWNKRSVFNPNSGKQIQAYITHKYGEHEIPRDKKTGKKTTGNEELERLARRYNDKLLLTIVDASSAGDKLSSFINNWPIGLDGRVHPTFTNNPATFRLSSVRPNSQNFPNRSEELNKMREMIIAGDSVEDDDWFLVEADYVGIEAIEVGWYARDPDYTRLAKFGIHSYVAGIKLGLDINPKWADDHLQTTLKEAKKLAKAKLVASGASWYDAVKRGIHGSNYLMGKKLLHDTYPDLFPSQKDAEEFQKFYFSLCPTVPKWQQSVIDLAYDQCCLMNDFGYRRWFWDAKRWQYDKRVDDWKLVPSGDAKKIVATLPQGSAAAIIRRAMLRPAFQTLAKEGKATIQIHDSLVARARRHEVERVVGLLQEAMTFPVAEQGGLVIPVECKVGKNWREFHHVYNPNGMKEFKWAA